MNRYQILKKFEDDFDRFLDTTAASPEAREIASKLAKIVDDHPWLLDEKLKKSAAWKLVMRHAQPGPWIAEEVRHEAKKSRPRSREQAIAIGMSRARRAGIRIPKT